MERITLQSDGGNLSVGDPDSPGIAGIELSTHLQSGFRRGCREEIKHHLMVHQRLAAPVLTSEDQLAVSRGFAVSAGAVLLRHKQQNGSA